MIYIEPKNDTGMIFVATDDERQVEKFINIIKSIDNKINIHSGVAVMYNESFESLITILSLTEMNHVVHQQKENESWQWSVQESYGCSFVSLA